MPEWKWYKELETGIDEIDDQHMELFRRIDKLELALYSGMGTAELNSLIQYLESYISEHFETEEDLIYRISYPGQLFQKHHQQHNEFRSLFKDIFSDFQERGADKYLAIEVDKKMRQWWENHILKLDMDYVKYYKDYQKKFPV